ncbi:MAG: DUF4437 domain-containing protein [Verrucomicrobiales bacterium]|nr:DUF4437 domain-containing protein [Verrucomicrobiota bacterium JB025]
MNTKATLASLTTLGAMAFAFAKSETPKASGTAAPNTPVVRNADVHWTHLNPKRGDLAPSAATLWGDRNGQQATGFLLRPSDGFESPPHIHNITYRGIVIRGLIHNDDPDAAEMWMPPGSFWTQPKGETHITAAKGDDILAYIEIDSGPYLVQPKEGAFDSGERPVNIDPSNIVWLDADQAGHMTPSSAASANPTPQVAFLWGEVKQGRTRGMFAKLPAEFSGTITSSASEFRAVVIAGNPTYTSPDTGKSETLEPGSYFSSDPSETETTHAISSAADSETLLYLRSNRSYQINAR